MDANHKKAVILLFEDKLTDQQIAKEVHRSRTTLDKWENDKDFQEAEREDRSLAFDRYVPDAIKQIHKLATGAKSDMVRLQPSTTILNMAGYSADGDSPEMAKQPVRKAKAEADIAEAKAKREADTNDSHVSVNITMPGDNDDND